MYREGVIKVKMCRYNKCSSELLQSVCSEISYQKFYKGGWIWKTCDSALIKGKMPIQAKANRLSLDKVPQELSTEKQASSFTQE